MTWANVVQGRTPKRDSSNIVASQAKPNDCVQVDPGIVERFNEVERRTQVLRKLPPTTTTTSILDDLKRQCEVPIKDVVEAVVQDSLDRRRFYIRYRTVEQKRANARRGFTVGEIQIPPERSDVQGYIPDLPHYVSRDDVVAILSKYGNVVSGNFKTYQDTDIRCGGFDFELDLHVNKRLPGTIKMLNDVFTLKLKNDIMVCSYCDKFGHLHRHCRQKQADLMKKAELELQQQIEAANAEADLMDDDEQDEQEPPPQTQSTSAPTIDQDHLQRNLSLTKRAVLQIIQLLILCIPHLTRHFPRDRTKNSIIRYKRYTGKNTRNTVPSSATTTPQTRKSKTPLGMML